MIRPGTKEDLPTVSMLWKDMVAEARKEWAPDEKKWASMGASLFDAGIYFLVVYEIEDEIVGFVDGISFDEPSTGKKHGVAQHFYVDPAYRGTEVSAKLYEEILYLAVKEDVEMLELFCFPEMQKFWEKRGFKKERILMRRPIDV